MKINNLSDFITFVSVVDAGGFTDAGKELGVSHSVISKRITRLEAELGARLLNRTTRKIALTEIGRALYERCAKIKKDLEEATQIVSASHDEPRGLLRINAPMSFGQLHLTSAVAEFMQRYPQLKIELLLGRQYADMIIEEGLDLSIQISDLPDSSFIAKKLAVRNTVICAAPGYLQKHGTPTHPKELQHHNCLLYKQKIVRHDWRFFIDGQVQSVRVTGNLIVNSSQAQAKAALAGLGIARLPGYLVNHEITNKQLIPILQEYCPKNIGIYAIYPHSRFLATKVKVFVEFLQERFKQQAWSF